MDVEFRRAIPKHFVSKLLEVYEILRDHADELEMQELWLFGSVARGDFNMLSDLDFCLNSTGEHHRVSLAVEALDVRDDIPDEQGRPPVDVMVVKPESVMSDFLPIYGYIRRDHLVLWKREAG